jgi:hypothetical protein
MCVEQFSHHHACVPGSPVFTSLADLYTLHFCFRDLMHNIYIYSCNCRCSLLTARKYFFTATQFTITVYNIQLALDLVLYSCLSHHLSSIFHCSYLFFSSPGHRPCELLSWVSVRRPSVR